MIATCGAAPAAAPPRAPRMPAPAGDPGAFDATMAAMSADHGGRTHDDPPSAAHAVQGPRGDTRGPATDRADRGPKHASDKAAGSGADEPANRSRTDQAHGSAHGASKDAKHGDAAGGSSDGAGTHPEHGSEAGATAVPTQVGATVQGADVVRAAAATLAGAASGAAVASAGSGTSVAAGSKVGSGTSAVTAGTPTAGKAGAAGAAAAAVPAAAGHASAAGTGTSVPAAATHGAATHGAATQTVATHGAATQTVATQASATHGATQTVATQASATQAPATQGAPGPNPGVGAQDKAVGQAAAGPGDAAPTGGPGHPVAAQHHDSTSGADGAAVPTQQAAPAQAPGPQVPGQQPVPSTPQGPVQPDAPQVQASAPVQHVQPTTQPPATAPAAPPAGAATPPPLADQLGVRLGALRTAPLGDHVLTMRVEPDSIGPVRVVAHIAHDGVRIELLGATDQARNALRQALPDLRRDLAATGMSADLDLGDHSGGDAGAESRGFGAPRREPIPVGAPRVATIRPGRSLGGLDLEL
ncbi:flagellar hook-length control protein FliK [Actinotalea lenta]|uniref:flagellar hook-length control protein FliK n=1 Tax=Actinotalea lenta TaxID=3064654 RepID=UPI002729935A|nr:flagellar hook-length control protein FliK [Isoptericola sp. b490]